MVNENNNKTFNSPQKNRHELKPFYVDYDGTINAIIAGCITGGIEQMLSYPIDLIKTRFQLQKPGEKPKVFGFSDITALIKTNGIKGLYRGLGVVMIFAVPQEGIRFGVFEAVKNIFEDEWGNINSSRIILAGLTAGVSEALLIVTPKESLKVRIIDDQRSSKPKYHSNAFPAIQNIVKKEGFRVLYQGITPTVLKHGTNQAIRFYIMETLKYRYREGDNTVHVPSPVLGLFGVFAGFVSVIVNNPLDVIKTRMQGIQGNQYKSTYDCAKRMYAEEGPKSFYNGLRTRILRNSFRGVSD